jgi:hypothetical protein
MLPSKHILSCFQRPSMHRFRLVIFPLAEENTAKAKGNMTRRKRCTDGRWKHERMCLDVSILTHSLVSCFQRPSMHRFRLVIFPLAEENTAKVTDTGECVRKCSL